MSEALSQPSFEELYKTLRALPEGQDGEIMEGKLVISRHPGNVHQVVLSAIVGKLGHRFGRGANGEDRPGGWQFLYRPEQHLKIGPRTDVVVPDLVGWRRENFAAPAHENYIDQTPEWACEVMVPATANRDRRVKARIYRDAGVQHLWLVDSRNRTVDAFRWHNGEWIWLGLWEETDKARIEPFESVELDLSLLWAALAPVKP